MKCKLLSILTMVFIYSSANAQNIEEPDFVGESIYLTPENTTVPLEKNITQSRSVASTGLILTGFGKYRTQLQIEGCCASTKISKKNNNIRLIIKAVDNNTDPFSIIKVFKFEQKKKFRRAEVASVNSFGSAKSNNLEYVSFIGKKFGKSSYLISISPKEVGEYGITVSNPNAIDEKSIVVSSFAITE